MKPKKQQNVYFVKPVGLDGPIKIGCSDVPANRLLALGAWSPFPLELIGSVPGVMTDESFMHQCFADTHSHREWFHFTPALGAAIAKVLAAGTVTILEATHTPKGSIRRSKRARSPEWRQWFSYSARVRWAERKLRKNGDGTPWHAPRDVCQIIDRRYSGKAISSEETARLDRYLANPASEGTIPSWYKPRPAPEQQVAA